MPKYDVECSGCGFRDIVSMKIADLWVWDKNACCPECSSERGIYRRVIRSAFAGQGDKARARLEISRKESEKQAFHSSEERDAMLHRESQTRDRSQIEEAVENVKRGRFEGF